MAAIAAAAGGPPPGPTGPPAPSNEVVEINDLLDKTKCYCLNEKDGSFGNLFIGMDDLTLKSDADEQLLMQFAFKDTVRLHSLNITAPVDDSAPQSIKVFVNRQDMGFDDCEHTEATQELDLSPGDLAADTRTELKFVKFQRVTTVTIFIETNQGEADSSVVSSIKFYGSSVAGTNMSEFKKVG